jgi:hypothetical protein
MRLSALLSLAGFIILIVGTYCLILRPFIGNWDVYDGSKPYGIVILLVAVIGILGTVLNQPNYPYSSLVLSYFSCLVLYPCTTQSAYFIQFYPLSLRSQIPVW